MESINLFKVFMADSVKDEVIKTLYSGYIGEGPKCVEFEKLVCDKIKNPLGLYVNSGTSALHLAYQLSVNGEENEPNHDSIILAPSTTCSATITPILANHVKVKWVDVDPLTGNMDPTDFERKICKNTKAVVMVHWGGNPCDIDKINEIAKKYSVKVIEDGAHSWGTKYKGEYLGNFSDFTMYSMQAIKHISSVEGGFLFCKDKENYDKAKLMRWFGIDRFDNRQQKDLRCENDIHYRGSKFQPNDVFATIGIENFKHFDEIVNKHKANAKIYDELFKDKIMTQPILPNAEPSYWLYTIHVKENRDTLIEKLKEDGIMSSKVHNNNHLHSVFKEYYSNLPGSDSFYKTHLCIPCNWDISADKIQYIAERVIYHVGNL